MITLHLYGSLAADYGEKISLNAATPREAVMALTFQCNKYKDILRSNDWHILVGEGNHISENELDIGLGKVSEVYLMPRIKGANGAFNFIVGAILFVVGAFTSWTGLGVPLMSLGAGMMVGGIIQMTTKVPGAADITRDGADDKASFLFSGPTNTATQGVAIPRGYGKMLIGSVVVSASIYAEQTTNFMAPEIELELGSGVMGKLISGVKWTN